MMKWVGSFTDLYSLGNPLPELEVEGSIPAETSIQLSMSMSDDHIPRIVSAPAGLSS